MTKEYAVHMERERDTLGEVRRAAELKVLYLPHALQQMMRPDRMIRRSEVRNVITQGTVIEDYLSDARGHSCLMLGVGAAGRPIHVVCAPREDYLAVVTAYLPGRKEWSDDFKTRVKT